jgi:hypothetical protein
MKVKEQVAAFEPVYEPGGKLTVAYCRRILEQNGQQAEEAKVVAMRDFFYQVGELEYDNMRRLEKTG